MTRKEELEIEEVELTSTFKKCCEKCTTCYYYWQNNDTENECLGKDEPCHEYIKCNG